MPVNPKSLKNLRPNRFNKGRSGNAKGREPGSVNLATIMKRMLDVKAPAKSLGQENEQKLRALFGDKIMDNVTIRELLLMRQIVNGLGKGLLPSTDYVLKVAKEFEESLRVNMDEQMDDAAVERVLARLQVRKRTRGPDA
jgi:hypothetical protein